MMIGYRENLDPGGHSGIEDRVGIGRWLFVVITGSGGVNVQVALPPT